MKERVKASRLSNCPSALSCFYYDSRKFKSDLSLLPVSQKLPITESEVAKLEMVVSKNEVDKRVQFISAYGKTLNPGDGIIYVLDVLQIYPVKTD